MERGRGGRGGGRRRSDPLPDRSGSEEEKEWKEEESLPMSAGAILLIGEICRRRRRHPFPLPRLKKKFPSKIDKVECLPLRTLGKVQTCILPPTILHA